MNMDFSQCYTIIDPTEEIQTIQRQWVSHINNSISNIFKFLDNSNIWKSFFSNCLLLNLTFTKPWPSRCHCSMQAFAKLGYGRKHMLITTVMQDWDYLSPYEFRFSYKYFLYILPHSRGHTSYGSEGVGSSGVQQNSFW